MKKFHLLFAFVIANLPLLAQKKALSYDDLANWNRIERPLLSNDGNWVAYTLKAEEGDATLYIWDAKTGKTLSFPRGEDASFSFDNQYLAFKIKPFQDTLKAQRRRKVKKEDLPKDSLGLLRLSDQNVVKIADVKSFALPEKWAGWVVFQKEIAKPDTAAKAAQMVEKLPADSLKTTGADTTKAQKPKEKKPKKETKDSGTKLVIRELATGKEEVVPFVKDYALAKEGARILAFTTGNDSTLLNGAYLFDCQSRALRPLFRQQGEFKQLTFDEKGGQATFFANLDTTKAQIPPFGLFYFKDGQDSARLIADTAAAFLPPDWLINEHERPVFSKDGSKLWFGMAAPPILQDTTLLEEEIVNVEVWNYQDGRLHTNQKTLLDREKKRAYKVVWHTGQNRFVPLGSKDLPEVMTANEGNAEVVLAYTEAPYLQLISWEGSARKDLYTINVQTGARQEIASGLRGEPRFSPLGNYAFWYSETDSAWFAYSLKDNVLRRLTDNAAHPFYDELNDMPDYPNSYGIAAWTKDDKAILVYDRYDIWQIDPEGKSKPINLTNGRGSRTTYRYIRLDPEERFVEPGKRLLLHVFDEKTKASGYAFLLLGAGPPITLVKENFDYTNRPLKAKNADRLLFTKENFRTFPDLLYADFTLQKPRKVSDANPQQANYLWGDIELVEWTSLDGQRLQGLLVKPEGFDPRKQYPMIVNFYERSSDELHAHRPPYPLRSSVNFTFYASRGYLVFNPDIPYRTGYPGESCYNAVIPGVTSLIDKGFVDKDRIGVQGHSWGGYQVAYLLTKTNLFRCAESGAPVVNMPSAYGGIRWETGLSRMFQYEHTQSRIGGTLWEYPLRYLENSPLFSMDKVNTPVLILANDKDGHVPWYQGIEYFTALRRLGKPAWMLNYNDEPHWPVKLQNRRDFQQRMSQFFDYYLKDAPMPVWMERGVPAMEKGILQGLELKE
jgi:dipeptidyl aminopeptidase/acylaminoacyl peptidase